MLENNTLVLFSGCKDSFLVTCKCMDRGEHIGLLSFDGGGISGEQSITASASRLISRYGENNIRFEGIYSTRALLVRLSEWWYKASQGELADNYPGLDNVQVTCLHCQTAMWTVAIAFATAKGYTTISADYRHDDHTCAGSLIFIEDIKRLAGRYKITIDLPLWDLCPRGVEWEPYRDFELSHYGFYPAVLEPRCMFDCVPSPHIRDIATPLNDYFNAHLFPIAADNIPKLREVFRKLQLSNSSLSLKDYRIPAETLGLY